MWSRVLFLLGVAVLGSSAMAPMALCASESLSSSLACTLTFTPFVTPHIGRTTTIYEAIMTTYHHVVDCGLCTVTNVESNAAPEGHFTAMTKSPMLTVTRVGCMPETTAVPEGTYRGYEEMAATSPQTRNILGELDQSSPHVHRRSDTSALLDFASSFANNIAPDDQLLSGPAQDLHTAILSAIFSLNVADSGLNLTAICAQLQTPEVKYKLLDASLNPDLIKSLECWIAEHGYSLNTTRPQLISTLEAAVYGLQVASDFTGNRTAICGDLDFFYSIGGYLGIDVAKYQDVVCKNLPSDTPTQTVYYGPTPIIPYVSNGITTWGTPTSWNPNTTAWGTGSPWTSNITTWGTPTPWTSNITAWGTGTPWTSDIATWGTGTPWDPNTTAWATGTSPAESNATTWAPPVSYTGTAGTADNAGASGTDWSATANPLANWTQTTATEGEATSGAPAGPWNETWVAARAPPNPTKRPFYPATETSTRHSLFKRY